MSSIKYRIEPPIKPKIITFVQPFDMWTYLAHFVLKFRLLLVISVLLMTVFMGYMARDLEQSYEFVKTVPANDPKMIEFESFRNRFGEDGNILAIGMLDSAIYTPENFYRLALLSDEISQVEGVNEVLSLPRLKQLHKDQENKRFYLEDIFIEIPQDQYALDSLLRKVKNIKFYSGQIYNEKNGATLILVTLDKSILNSEKRISITDEIHNLGEQFTEKTNIELRYAGLPFVRSVIASQIKREMINFLIISVIICGLIMWALFRSWDAVVFPLIIIAIVVIWSMGLLSLLGYKVTILTGLLPPIIVVIGIPNSIYLLNKYHQEIEKHSNKARALSAMIRKVGVATFITNLTTAIGFGVLIWTKIIIMREFGIVSSIIVMATFVVSLIILPAVFSYLPSPKGKQLEHLKLRLIDKFLTGVDLLVHRYKFRIFFVVGVIVVIAGIGIYRVNAVSYMVDDIPSHSRIKQDLTFFEEHFSGVMPLEVVVDTGRKRGVFLSQNLKKFEELENFLEADPYISRPISIVSFVKAARQSFYNNNPDFYSLPTQQEQSFIFRYFTNASGQADLLKSFMDSTGQELRISMKMADIGSNRMDELIENTIKPKIEEIFQGTDIKAFATGTTMLFVRGNKFLISNLQQSLLLAFILIGLVMAGLFSNKKIIIFSLFTNLIPMIITAGLMGYADIPFKPSTAITFAVAFGISVDYSFHFLAKYRQELYANNFFVPLAVSKTIREIGASMIYSALVLFSGFVIFAFSTFGGTIALGKLTSTTLLISMFTNIIFLPALLLAFDSGKRKKDRHSLIDRYENFYHEEEDEEIDVDLIRVDKKNRVTEEF